MWYGGLVADEERHAPPPEPRYYLRAIVAGTPQDELEFDSCIALEEFIALRYPHAARATLPPAPPEETARLQKAFALLDHPPGSLPPQFLRSMLAGMLYQWSHPPDTVARLRRELGLPPLANG